ncbi:MAG: YafY family transcriptional regulator [Acidobacteria bacterium]|nr:YafY family transcriptional regulator [Acidobacteriota bacterium]
MRRADRLFRIVQRLRRGRVVTARQLAEELEVSDRTIYRDIRDLAASGVPLASEAGVGYLLKDYDLPPLMFHRDEVEALVLGARIVESWTDPELGRAARSALEKIEAVLPEGKDHLVAQTALFAPSRPRPRAETLDFASLRRAIREQRRIRFAYTDAQGAATNRAVWPLALAFFGSVWTLLGWCELRDDFRNFRPDRMSDLEVLADTFPSLPGRTLEDFVCRMEVVSA